MRSGNGLALLLIAFGALLILGKLGIFGFLMGLLIPILVIGLGVLAWRNGSRFLGGVIGLIGALLLLGKLSFLFVWAAAIALIIFGISRIRRRPGTRV
jgi:LiaF transmembrane domain